MIRPSQTSGPPAVDHYAPDFRVEVGGRELDPETKGDVLELKVTMDMQNMASADITFSNWDDRHLTFKYSDTALLDVGKPVHVHMGYADRLLSMLRGQVNSLSSRFPQSGTPTISVGVLDGMQLLKGRKPKEREPVKYTGLADWQVAKEIARRNGLRAEVTEEGEPHPEVVQKNQDDAQFLMERAKRIDFECYIHTDPESGESVLRFIKPTDARSSGRIRAYRLVWGENDASFPFTASSPGQTSTVLVRGLLSFSPTLTLSDQVSGLTVRGWSSRTKQPIVYRATASDLPGSAAGGTSGPAAAERSLNARQEVVVDAPVTSEQEARELAISLLRERAYEFITGFGEVIGLPDLRPGDNLELDGLGQRFSGLYYVKKVEHTIGLGGYLTGFEVRRVFDGGIGGR